MRMFGHRRSRHRLAASLLLLWCFALAAGVVNACVLEPGLRDARAGALRVHGESAAHGHEAGALGHAHGVPAADKLPCAKFCDDASASVPPLKQPDLLAALALAPPPRASLAVAFVPVWAARQVERPCVQARVPIPIAFLRLTL